MCVCIVLCVVIVCVAGVSSFSLQKNEPSLKLVRTKKKKKAAANFHKPTSTSNDALFTPTIFEGKMIMSQRFQRQFATVLL